MNYKEKTKKHINNKILFCQLEKYVQMIEDKNKVINLTRFKEDKLWQEGIYESIISLENFFPKFVNKKMLDIGAGAGFPSIPFKIVHPEVKLFIYEPLQKRAVFLQEVSNILNLNIKIKTIRAEDSQEKNFFSLITARAVTKLQALIEISFHLGKKGCNFGFIKGPNVEEEKKFATKIINRLKITINIDKVQISNKTLYLVKYTKKSIANSKYPRKWSKISKEL